MQWIAPSEKDVDTAALEKRLWNAANQLWAGAGLKQSEYSEPVLAAGLAARASRCSPNSTRY